MTEPITVALAVSGHGFGHAVRSAEVAQSLVRRGARVVLRTDAPAWLFPPEVQRIPSPGWPLDVGVAQRDGLDMDLDETLRRWTAFDRHFDERVSAEAALLREYGAHVLLGDMPPLAFAAAAEAAIPSAAMTNFGWDWIYAAWPGFERAVERVRNSYARAAVLLRLPLHSTEADAFPAFRRIEDVPLVARQARFPRQQVRAEHGIPVQARVVLLSFGGFDAARLDVAALGTWDQYLFLLTPSADIDTARLPPNVRLLPAQQPHYPSLLRACDAVVTKPGYGIVSDCLANRVPVLYTDRGPFREYDVLAAALERLGPARYLPQPQVRAGHLGPGLDALLADTRPWAPIPLDGADRVADRVLTLARS